MFSGRNAGSKSNGMSLVYGAAITFRCNSHQFLPDLRPSRFFLGDRDSPDQNPLNLILPPIDENTWGVVVETVKSYAEASNHLRSLLSYMPRLVFTVPRHYLRTYISSLALRNPTVFANAPWEGVGKLAERSKPTTS